MNQTSRFSKKKAASHNKKRSARGDNRVSLQKSKPAEAPPVTRTRRKPVEGRIAETVPLILRTQPDHNYALIDSGNGRKLERYGPYVVDRPEAQAIWQPSVAPSIWRIADAIFTGDVEEDGAGRWQFPNEPLGETWPMQWNGIDYYGRFTAFRHVGIFPEQGAHWRFIQEALAPSKGEKPAQKPRVLNLFGYTGLASLVAAQAGAQVTHVDASKKAIGWARENQSLAKMENLPIRWICDDAVKFCEREIRRGNKYDGILLDPPKYGRGPKGEVWQLFEDLPFMIDMTRELLSDNAKFAVLTSYSIRSSFYAMHEIMREVFGDLPGCLESGELVLETENNARLLSTSLFSRWVRNPHG